MEAVAYSNFRSNLKTYMEQVNDNTESLIVTSKEPNNTIVVMGKDEYDSLMETIRVYRNPYLFNKIKKGMETVKKQETKPHELIEVDDE